MKQTLKIIVIAFAIALAAVRPLLLFWTVGEHAQSSYEAAAHLLVGGLYSAYLYWRLSGRAVLPRPSWLLHTANGLTLVEILCAAAMVLGGLGK